MLRRELRSLVPHLPVGQYVPPSQQQQQAAGCGGGKPALVEGREAAAAALGRLAELRGEGERLAEDGTGMDRWVGAGLGAGERQLHSMPAWTRFALQCEGRCLSGASGALLGPAVFDAWVCVPAGAGHLWGRPGRCWRGRLQQPLPLVWALAAEQRLACTTRGWSRRQPGCRSSRAGRAGWGKQPLRAWRS